MKEGSIMNKDTILKERRSILDRIMTDMQEDLTPALMREPEGENDPPILSVVFEGIGMEHEEAFGEFYFLPLPDEKPLVQYFAAIITIADELEDEHLSELFEAMSYINFTIPCGSYSIDSEKRFLAYRLTVPLPMDMDSEALYNELNVVIGNAVAVADIHADILLKVLSGEMSVEEVKKLL